MAIERGEIRPEVGAIPQVAPLSLSEVPGNVGQLEDRPVLLASETAYISEGEVLNSVPRDTGRRTTAESQSDEPVVMLYDRLPLVAHFDPRFYADMLVEALQYRNPQYNPDQASTRASALLMRAWVLSLAPIPGVVIRSVLAYTVWAAINPKDALAQVANPLRTLAQIGGDRIGQVIEHVRRYIDYEDEDGELSEGEIWERAGEAGRVYRADRVQQRHAAAHKKYLDQFRKNHAEEIAIWAEKYHVSEEEAIAHLMQKEFVETHRERILEFARLFTPRSLQEVLPTVLQMIQDELDDKNDIQAIRTMLRIPEAVAVGVALGIGALFLSELIPLALAGFAAMMVFPLMLRIVIPHLEAGYDRAREAYLKRHPQYVENN